MFFTDGRYTQQAREEVKDARVVIARGPLLSEAAKLLNKLSSAAIGFEADLTTVAMAAQMKQLVHRRIEWKATAGLIMRQRMIKDREELKLIRKAVKLGAKVYEEALKVIRPGVRETEVAGKLEFAARQAGADGMSFDTIVAAGQARSVAAWTRVGSAHPQARIRGGGFGCYTAWLLFRHDAHSACGSCGSSGT